jgi:SAM-dependent methyltransferase
MENQPWPRETTVNKWGFRSLTSTPSAEELSQYYAERYYQEDLAIYQHTYEDLEKSWIQNTIVRKHFALKHFVPSLPENAKYLDVGCGEGHTLKYFQDLGWDVQGLDYSIQGIRNHNPELEYCVTSGDVFASLNEFTTKESVFDVVWLDNVLEHVPDPLNLLESLHRVLAPNGVLVVEVPNDFSIIQEDLAKRDLIPDLSWVFAPDHISYFNREGLRNIAEDAGYVERGAMSNLPIEFFLYNPMSNYYAKRELGKAAHEARMMIESLLSHQEPEKNLNLGVSMAEIGLGREIFAVFTKNPNL